MLKVTRGSQIAPRYLFGDHPPCNLKINSTCAIIMVMKKEIDPGTVSLPRETQGLLYEAAEAEDRFRELGMDALRISGSIDWQLAHELTKLAKRGIATNGALQKGTAALDLPQANELRIARI